MYPFEVNVKFISLPTLIGLTGPRRIVGMVNSPLLPLKLRLSVTRYVLLPLGNASAIAFYRAIVHPAGLRSKTHNNVVAMF